MTITTDGYRDDLYFTCNKHKREDCPVCSHPNLNCRVCGNELEYINEIRAGVHEECEDGE